MNEEIELIVLTKNKLRKLVDDNTFWKQDIAPLPRSKASWLIMNARICEDDYCGIMAVENEKMVAFIYMFPDLINNYDTDKKKVYWMNDWWVHPKYKDTILGTYLYNQAIKLTKNQVLIKSYTENVEAFYSKLPFKVIASRLRHTIFFSLDSSMLIGKFSSLKKIRFFIEIFDKLIGKVIRTINIIKLGNKTASVNLDYVNEIDNETWTFIEPLCKYDLIFKTKDYINWHINQCQYLQIPLRTKVAYRNLNTGISNNIHIHNLKILCNNIIVGFISYVINFNELNVKYFLVGKDDDYNLCVDVLIENLLKLKRNFIFTDDTKLSNTICKRYYSIYTHKVLKKGLAHNDTKFDYDSVSMLNSDGHFY